MALIPFIIDFLNNLMSVLKLLVMKKVLIQLMSAGIMLVMVTSCNQGVRVADPAKYGMSPDTLARASDLMQGYVDEGKIAGASLLVYKDGAVVQREYIGYSDIENQVPFEDNTIFRIYSMTKPVTAAALMTLYDDGKFKLDDKVSDYIPEFEFMMVYSPQSSLHYLEFPAEQVTIRHLLTHTSGIPYGWDPDSFVDSLYRVNRVSGWDGTIGEKVKMITEMPLKNAPGTKWEYGLSIDVAGYLIEVLSGLPLDEFFRTRIFEPLGMDDTGFFVPEEKHARLSSLYYRSRDGLTKAEYPDGDSFKAPATLFSGGGGLVSTVPDYLKFCEMLLNGGILNGKRILEESTVKMIMSDQLPEGVTYGDGMGFGLAGAVDPETGEYSWMGAATTNFWINPTDNMITMVFIQMMPSDHRYANEYKKIVDRAVME
jgi:CubicO group peptidase (beta-lactamase class C family)